MRSRPARAMRGLKNNITYIKWVPKDMFWDLLLNEKLKVIDILTRIGGFA